MAKIGYGIIAVVILLSILPFAFIARSRASKSDNTAVHLVHDMDQQPKNKAQSPSPVFADGRSMRPLVEGTLAREDLSLHPEILNDPDNPRIIDNNDTPIDFKDPSTYAALTLGRIRPITMTDQQFAALKPPADDKAVAEDTAVYVRTIPSQIHVTADFLRRGQERFNIYCAPCHGQSGYGDGPVARRAASLKDAGVTDGAPGWTAPQDLHQPQIRTFPDGHLFNTITNGVRTMPPYDKQISILDRWAIVAYVRALEKSQNESNAPIPTTTAPATKP